MNRILAKELLVGDMFVDDMGAYLIVARISLSYDYTEVVATDGDELIFEPDSEVILERRIADEHQRISPVHLESGDIFSLLTDDPTKNYIADSIFYHPNISVVTVDQERINFKEGDLVILRQKRVEEMEKEEESRSSILNEAVDIWIKAYHELQKDKNFGKELIEFNEVHFSLFSLFRRRKWTTTKLYLKREDIVSLREHPSYPELAIIETELELIIVELEGDIEKMSYAIQPLPF